MATHQTIPIKGNMLSIKKILFVALFLSVICILINPLEDRQAEAKKLKLKLKDKKVIKSVVKGLIYKNLSTRKNFLPLPVPIPGKWQKMLTSIAESGVFSADSHRDHISSSGDSSSSVGKHKSNLLANLVSLRGYTSGSKLSTKPTLTNRNSMDLNNIKKYTRLTAAKMASKLSKLPGKSSHSSSSSSFAKPAIVIKSKMPKLHSQASVMSNDPLVILYNIAKFAKQVKELDREKMLKFNKKSSLILANMTNKRPPVLSMNINNRKSFINEMNYIHKLTTSTHRHRWTT